MAHFICPNCGDRSVSQDRTAGFTERARGCAKCGFGFLFELLDDYYPAPNAAFVVCDADAKVIGVGRGVRELTGLGEEEGGGGGTGAGTDQITVVPAPVAERTSKVPPCLCALSRMLPRHSGRMPMGSRAAMSELGVKQSSE